MAKIFVALPSQGSAIPETIGAVMRGSFNHIRDFMSANTGNAPHCFNVLWSAAYNQRAEKQYTHFSMIHHDIRVEDGYLDVLIDEMDRVDADILSVVVAVGDKRGLSSTGVMKANEWTGRRFTMAEIYDLPETFSIADTETPDRVLAINNGLWICKFTDPWVKEFQGFVLHTKIVDVDDKKYPTQFSEDWNFSKWAAERNLKVFATRKVKAWHRKSLEFPNDKVWGEWETDRDYIE